MLLNLKNQNCPPTDQPTDHPSNQQTDTCIYRAPMELKINMMINLLFPKTESLDWSKFSHKIFQGPSNSTIGNSVVDVRVADSLEDGPANPDQPNPHHAVGEVVEVVLDVRIVVVVDLGVQVDHKTHGDPMWFKTKLSLLKVTWRSKRHVSYEIV